MHIDNNLLNSFHDIEGFKIRASKVNVHQMKGIINSGQFRNTINHFFCGKFYGN